MEVEMKMMMLMMLMMVVYGKDGLAKLKLLCLGEVEERRKGMRSEESEDGDVHRMTKRVERWLKGEGARGRRGMDSSKWKEQSSGNKRRRSGIEEKHVGRCVVPSCRAGEPATTGTRRSASWQMAAMEINRRSDAALQIARGRAQYGISKEAISISGRLGSADVALIVRSCAGNRVLLLDISSEPGRARRLSARRGKLLVTTVMADEAHLCSFTFRFAPGALYRHQGASILHKSEKIKDQFASSTEIEFVGQRAARLFFFGVSTACR